MPKFTRKISLIEETKKLERHMVDSLTFTNPLGRMFAPDAEASWAKIGWGISTDAEDTPSYNEIQPLPMGLMTALTSGVSPELLSKAKDYSRGWEAPRLYQSYIIGEGESEVRIKLESNYKTFEDYSRLAFPFFLDRYFIKDIYDIYLSIKKNLGGGNYATIIDNQPWHYSTLLNHNYTLILNGIDKDGNNVGLAGEYNIIFELRWWKGYNDHSSGSPLPTNSANILGVGICKYNTSISIVNASEVGEDGSYNANPPHTITDVLKRIIELTPQRCAGEAPVFYLDPVIAEKYSNVEAPELAFTKCTLREALEQVGSYIHKRVVLRGNMITYIDYLTGEEAILPNNFRYQERNSNIEQYCSTIDTNVDNLVGLNNTRIGQVVEPFSNGWISPRAEEGTIEINEDSCIIRTAYPIYQLIKLEADITAVQSDTPVLDLTPYCYEDAEYHTLSDTSATYPFSKAYALRWKSGDKGIRELGHRIKTSTSTEAALVKPALGNIVSKLVDANISASVLDVFIGLFTASNANYGNFVNLKFRITYIPVISARIKQYKQHINSARHYSAIPYNQNAHMVESEYYGEHLRGVVNKLGNSDMVRIYDFETPSQLPKLGSKFGDYYIYRISAEYYSKRIIAAIYFTKNFNRTSTYIGINNNLRMFDVSEKQCFDRYVNYDEFCVLSEKKRGIYNSAFRETALEGMWEDCLPITCMAVQTYTADVNGSIVSNKSTLKNLVVPAVSLAVGNSIMITAKLADNYSAGDSSEVAPSGAEGLSGKNYKRASLAVPYGNKNGDVDTVNLYLSNTLSAGSHHDLPEKTLDVLDTGRSYFALRDLIVKKDSREALTFTVQQHYMSDDNDLIIGSGLSNFNRLVGGECSEFRVYGLTRYIGKYERHLDLAEKDEDGNSVIVHLGNLTHLLVENEGSIYCDLSDIDSNTANDYQLDLAQVYLNNSEITANVFITSAATERSGVNRVTLTTVLSPIGSEDAIAVGDYVISANLNIHRVIRAQPTYVDVEYIETPSGSAEALEPKVYKSYAVVGVDDAGKRQIMFARNRKTDETSFADKVYFWFTREYLKSVRFEGNGCRIEIGVADRNFFEIGYDADKQITVSAVNLLDEDLVTNFDGWYDGTERVSTANPWTFTANKSTNGKLYTAKIG